MLIKSNALAQDEGVVTMKLIREEKQVSNA